MTMLQVIATIVGHKKDQTTIEWYMRASGHARRFASKATQRLVEE